MIHLKDNSKIDEKHADNLLIEELVDRSMSDLAKENFIVFPPTVSESIDLEDDNFVFRKSNRQLFTGNIVGVLKKGKNEIRINSRFCNANDGHDDYLIRYLLQKVMNINVISQKVNISNDFSYYDLLAFLFPMYLEDAMQKGVYKEYIGKYYNDANVKGPIDVGRHVNVNTPFLGKISYNTREFSYDNKLTQLIRHTIEKLRSDYNFNVITDFELRSNFILMIGATPKYSRLERKSILEANVHSPVRHGYYEEYFLLQKLCIQILKEEEIGFGDENNEVHGIIIDVSWLWEAYLATLLTPLFTHSDNKTRTNPIYFYANKRNPRYPDFYSEYIILDAKYKSLDKLEKGIPRDDLYQITSYLHVHKAKSAGLIFPSKYCSGYFHAGELAGYGGNIFKIGFSIPQKPADEEFSYTDFINEMRTSEEKLLIDLNREKNQNA
jgi:5-methylcytosine-specific restriction endonuclease McrBC regulatory subunit McrC